LLELMIALAVIGVAALGGLSYQYHATKHAKVAQAQITATRMVQMLLEDWKSTGGSTDYDPESLGMGISATYPVSLGPGGFAELGSTLNGEAYHVEVAGLPMVMVLKYKDVDYDAEADVTLRQLAIVVGFGTVSAETATLTDSRGWVSGVPPVTLTTYVRVDASGG